MLKVILAAAILVGAGVFGLCFNIIFRKKPFPQSDVGSNEKMRQMGIRCFKDQEKEMMQGLKGRGTASCDGNYSEACKSCGLYGRS